MRRKNAAQRKKRRSDRPFFWSYNSIFLEKSYGRAPTFLMKTGYEQVRSVVAEIAGDRKAARRVELVLPETGVCSSPFKLPGPDGCCGGPSKTRAALPTRSPSMRASPGADAARRAHPRSRSRGSENKAPADRGAPAVGSALGDAVQRDFGHPFGTRLSPMS